MPLHSPRSLVCIEVVWVWVWSNVFLILECASWVTNPNSYSNTIICLGHIFSFLWYSLRGNSKCIVCAKKNHKWKGKREARQTKWSAESINRYVFEMVPSPQEVAYSLSWKNNRQRRNRKKGRSRILSTCSKQARNDQSIPALGGNMSRIAWPDKNVESCWRTPVPHYLVCCEEESWWLCRPRGARSNTMVFKVSQSCHAHMP